MPQAVRVAVTGAAGQIAYSLLPRIASGEVFGPDTPVILQLLEITPALKVLEGVAMELYDCAPGNLVELVCTDDFAEAFGDANAVFLIGGQPRGPGMLRGDLIRENAPIFKAQGQAIGQFAAPDVKVLTVANPCNTNCLVAATNASVLDPVHFQAMTRLDHNRAMTQLALKAGTSIAAVKNVVIWGNHSAKQVPDANYATIAGQKAYEVLDKDWLEGEFCITVAGRGKAIIDARGKSSAGSAANAAIDHMRDWFGTTPEGVYVSKAPYSTGRFYDIPEGIFCSLPVTVKEGVVAVVDGLEVSDYARVKLRVSVEELVSERDAIKALLG